MDSKRSTNQKLEDLDFTQLKDSKQSMAEVYAQMVIDELTYLFRKKQLEALIDKSLEEKNKKEFMTLTTEYKKIIEK